MQFIMSSNFRSFWVSCAGILLFLTSLSADVSRLPDGNLALPFGVELSNHENSQRQETLRITIDGKQKIVVAISAGEKLFIEQRKKPKMGFELEVRSGRGSSRRSGNIGSAKILAKEGGLSWDLYHADEGEMAHGELRKSLSSLTHEQPIVLIIDYSSIIVEAVDE